MSLSKSRRNSRTLLTAGSALIFLGGARSLTASIVVATGASGGTGGNGQDATATANVVTDTSNTATATSALWPNGCLESPN
jgi:hypothetical protein